MSLRTLLLCEGVRVERSGQLTAVGIFSEIVEALPMDKEGALFLPHFSILAVIRGVKGLHTIAHRFRIMCGDELLTTSASELREDTHAPDRDEHNLIFMQAPMPFGSKSEHVAVLEVRDSWGISSFEYPFQVVLAADARET